MVALFGLLGFFGSLVCLLLIIINAIRKKKLKPFVIGLLICFVVFAVCIAITPSKPNVEVAESVQGKAEIEVEEKTEIEVEKKTESLVEEKTDGFEVEESKTVEKEIEETKEVTETVVEQHDEISLIDDFVTKFNINASTPIVDVKDIDISKGSDHYRTEFRLGAFSDADAKCGSIDGNSIEIINYGSLSKDDLRIYYCANLEEAKAVMNNIALMMYPDSTAEDIKIISDNIESGKSGCIYKNLKFCYLNNELFVDNIAIPDVVSVTKVPETIVEYDELENVFIALNDNSTEDDLLELIDKYDLEYTAQDYNGTPKKKQYKLAYTHEVALQKYADSGDYVEVTFNKMDGSFMYAEYFNQTAFKAAVHYNYGTYWDFREKEANNNYTGYYYHSSGDNKGGITIQYSNGNSKETGYYNVDSAEEALNAL